MNRPVHILVLPGAEILDIAGPVQAFAQANRFGASYDLHYCGWSATAITAQGFAIGNLNPFPEVEKEGWILIPGVPPNGLSAPAQCVDWLKESAGRGATLISVCTGAFLLGAAGLLDGRKCTTHWNRVAELQSKFPRARVVDDVLFVQDGRLITSAGIAAGIDMAICLIEDDAGPQIASAVARDMVVALRRNGNAPQLSVYLRHQNHLHAGIHRVQQYLVEHPEARTTIEELAAIAYMSPRNLTRTFRNITGTSVGEYRERLRMARAQTLLETSSMRIDTVARECGFRNARQLRRVWKKHHGQSPRESRTR